VVYRSIASVRVGRGDRGAERRRCWFPLHPAFCGFRCPDPQVVAVAWSQSRCEGG
jgi:hypothetical protein